MPSRLWMFHAGRASERPGLRDLWPTRLLANFWQNGFLMTSPLEGESENRRVYIEWWAWVDLNHQPRPYQGHLWCYMHSIMVIRKFSVPASTFR
jgi:hypothetical protein